MVEPLNAIARLWWDWSVAMFWQVGLLILLIAAIDRLIRRWAWPQLRYALWSLILVKLLLPPSLSLPSGIIPGLEPVVKQALARLESERSPAAESSVLFSLNEDMLSGSVPARASRSTGILPVSSMGVSPMIPDHGQDARATHGRDAHATGFDDATRAGVFAQVAWQVHAMTASLVGTLILGIWLFFRLHSLVGRNAQIAAAASLPQSFYNQLAGCARRLELRCIPRVVVTRRLATPAVFGVFRPVLLMPRGYLSRLSRRDTEHMLLHELAHIKRGDLAAHSVYMLLQIVYWYNPLLWLVRRQMHHLRELSCDATVAELLREQTTAYRQTLLETARRLLTSSVEPGLGLLGLFEDSNRLLVRLDWLTKPTWRHRTMKRVTVTVIAALMLACVLPMARAQEAASNEQSPDVVKHEEPSSQDIAALRAQLEQLMAQQQQLQEQLRALMEKRGETRVKDMPSRARPVVVTTPSEKKTDGDRKITVVPWQDKEPSDAELRELREAEKKAVQAYQEQARAMLEMKRAQLEAEKAQLEAGKAAIEGERAKAEAKRQKEWAKDQQKWAEQMEQWRAGVEEWQNGEEMRRWKQEGERWGQELARRYGQASEGSAHDLPADGPGPMPTMPPMPPMPAMPAAPPAPAAPLNVRVAPVAQEPHPVPQVPTPVVEAAPPATPTTPAKPHKPGQTVSCGDFIVKSFPAGTVLDVENNVGSMVIEGTEGRDCSVTATADIKGVDREEAERIAEKILVQVTPSDGRVRVRLQMPEGMNEGQDKQISIALHIAVPADAKVQVAQKVGDVRLSSLLGDVKAVVEVGSIKTRDLQGDVALRTNVGDIHFATSKDLSAKVRAQTQVGSISSNLDLETTTAAVMRSGDARNALGSHATGTLGDGQNRIELTTNVGSIRIQREPTPPRHEVF